MMNQDFTKSVGEMASYLKENNVQRVTAREVFVSRPGFTLPDNFKEQAHGEAGRLLGGRAVSAAQTQALIRAAADQLALEQSSPS